MHTHTPEAGNSCAFGKEVISLCSPSFLVIYSQYNPVSYIHDYGLFGSDSTNMHIFQLLRMRFYMKSFYNSTNVLRNSSTIIVIESGEDAEYIWLQDIKQSIAIRRVDMVTSDNLDNDIFWLSYGQLPFEWPYDLQYRSTWPGDLNVSFDLSMLYGITWSVKKCLLYNVYRSIWNCNKVIIRKPLSAFSTYVCS